MAVSRRVMLSGFASGVAAVGAGALMPSGPAQGSPTGGRLREYWLQIDHVRHDLAPHKYDPMMGAKITEPTKIDALVYRAYTPHWGRPLPGSAALGPNTGFPGPVLRAHVGDHLRVHVRNNDTYYQVPHSVHPHGVRYTPAMSGSWTARNPQRGSAIPVGKSFTYEWDAVASSVGTWPYHDHSVPFHAGGPGTSKVRDTRMHMAPVTEGSEKSMEVAAELGLMGHIIVEEPGAKRPDREIYLVFHDMYAEDVAGLTGDVDCFNGHAFLGNTPTFRAKVGDHVRWHIIALGSEFHVFHLHGHRWRDPSGRWIDSQILGPSTSIVVDYVEDIPGDWLYHCHVVEHMEGGMFGGYIVTT